MFLMDGEFFFCLLHGQKKYSEQIVFVEKNNVATKYFPLHREQKKII